MIVIIINDVVTVDVGYWLAFMGLLRILRHGIDVVKELVLTIVWNTEIGYETVHLTTDMNHLLSDVNKGLVCDDYNKFLEV